MQRSVPLLRLLSTLLLLTWRAPAPAPAQEADAACPQGRVSSVFIDAHSVFDLTDPDLNGRYGWAYRLVNRVHVPTQEEVIRREILFKEGDCYDVEQLRDSERLLRGLTFIADVDIFGVRQSDGSIHVIVDTQDEWSTRIQPKLGGGGPSVLRGLRLREDNLMGSGRSVAAFYQNDEEAQVYGAAYHTPQFLRTRWDATLEGGKTPVGYLYTQALTYPFVGMQGRWAFRQRVQHNDRYFEYQMPVGDRLAKVWLPERRRSVDVGAAYRWRGRGYNRTLVGIGLAGEWVSYPKEARYADDEDERDGPRGDLIPLPPLPAFPMDSVSSVRAMFLTGQRNVYYVRRRALDTVRGTEDVRLGVETELAIGPSLPGLSSDHDLALDFGFFAGGELPGDVVTGAQLVVEARRRYDAPPEKSEWSDVFGQLHGWAYWRPSPDSHHTLVASLAAVGGWHTRVPFQLTLGSDVGLRGYERHEHPGARRVVASLEQRSYLGWPAAKLFDLGAAAFVDVGKIWAGDVPFGVTSPVRVDAGVGLRAAFPPGSRQTLRLDVGVPLHSGARARDIVVSVGIGQVIGLRTVRRDPQLMRSASPGLSTSLFVFPN